MVKKVVGHGTARDDYQAQDAAKENAAHKLESMWLGGTLASPLHDLCDVGGKELCFEVSVVTDAPDW